MFTSMKNRESIVIRAWCTMFQPARKFRKGFRRVLEDFDTGLGLTVLPCRGSRKGTNSQGKRIDPHPPSTLYNALNSYGPNTPFGGYIRVLGL